MLYGDRTVALPTAAKLAEIEHSLRAATAAPSGIERHASLVEALIAAGELLQAIADRDFESIGADEDTPAQAAATTLLRFLAEAVARSWVGGFTVDYVPNPDLVDELRRQQLPERLTCKVPEGYAYYAVYPEAYLEAAAELARSPAAIVIGIRSIGTALAAIVAAALGADAKITTLRPFGHPFDRQVRLAGTRKRCLMARGSGIYVVVDEGPGLSGSSFVAVAQMLQDLGLESSSIVFMPSHCGGPGPRASEAARRCWVAVRKQHKEFDTVFITTRRSEHRLERWVRDLTGPLVAPLQDISGGSWRDVTRQSAPALPRFERRKFLAYTAADTYLLKFTGLGREGRAKADRARVLAEAGFTPPVLGFRHGFLVQQWCAGPKPVGDFDRESLIAWLGRYLAFRAERFAARAEDGAGMPALCEMTRINVGEALGPEIARELEERVVKYAERAAPPRPIHTDGRLHRWEWLTRADGSIQKTDAIDHSRQHDLIGCQDLAWDIVGARLELDLDPTEIDSLIRALEQEHGVAVDRNLLAAFAVVYPAFQLALWQEDTVGSLEDVREVAAHAARYRNSILELAA
jgi:hypothetical protein